MKKLSELKNMLRKLPQGSIPLGMPDKVLKPVEGRWDKSGDQPGPSRRLVRCSDMSRVG
jgi:hypothetical protein